jgi:hypothetical protein
MITFASLILGSSVSFVFDTAKVYEVDPSNSDLSAMHHRLLSGAFSADNSPGNNGTNSFTVKSLDVTANFSYEHPLVVEFVVPPIVVQGSGFNIDEKEDYPCKLIYDIEKFNLTLNFATPIASQLSLWKPVPNSIKTKLLNQSVDCDFRFEENEYRGSVDFKAPKIIIAGLGRETFKIYNLRLVPRLVN